MINFQSFKGRTKPLPYEIVEVYRNLNNKTLSIRNPISKEVYGHCDAVQLSDVTFKVLQKSRERVLRDKRKNVHAVVKGRLDETLDTFESVNAVTYNPYKYNSFVDKVTEAPIHKAEKVRIYASGEIYVQANTN